MADIEFAITAGPYAGNYSLDIGDITANDVGDLLAQHGPDLDAVLTGGGATGTRAIAGLVWVVRRRGNKGLAYRSVAEHITMAVIDAVPDEDAKAAGTAGGVPDPSNSESG